jgi:RNA polymerase primary sigma factor
MPKVTSNKKNQKAARTLAASQQTTGERPHRGTVTAGKKLNSRAETKIESLAADQDDPVEPKGTNGLMGSELRSGSGEGSVDLQERLRELLKLAKEQGYLTYDDINEALPDGMADPDEMDQLLSRLRTMEVDIIDASEVDRLKDGKKDLEDDEEDKEPKLDILDDPVRMSLRGWSMIPPVELIFSTVSLPL